MSQSTFERAYALTPETIEAALKVGRHFGKALAPLVKVDKVPLSTIEEIMNGISTLFKEGMKEGMRQEVFKEPEPSESVEEPEEEIEEDEALREEQIATATKVAETTVKTLERARSMPTEQPLKQEPKESKTYQCDDCGEIFRHLAGDRIICPTCGGKNTRFTRLLPHNERPAVSPKYEMGVTEDVLCEQSLSEDGKTIQVRKVEEKPEPPQDTKKLKEKRKKAPKETDLSKLKNKLKGAQLTIARYIKSGDKEAEAKLRKVITDLQAQIAEMEG